MKVIVCAYRDWAIPLVSHIEKHPRVSHVRWVCDNDTLHDLITQQSRHGGEKFDMVLFVGWSTPPSKHLVDTGIPMFSEHPATSDRYSPGTPLQNQILDGVRRTKHRIVKVGFPELSPRQWSHEVDLDLTGSMKDILAQMQATSKHLFNMFLDDYPNVTWKTWDEVPANEQVPRRTPEQSKLDKEQLANIPVAKLYDMIRCLEDPYPNAYIEDETGRLYFKHVEFKAKQ